MSELKPPAEMTRGELAREINQANYREPGPWSDEEWRRFLAVASEFISRVGQDDIEVDIKRTKRIATWLFSGLVIILILIAMVIFGVIQVQVITR